VKNPWVTFGTPGDVAVQVYLDNTGVFANKLLAVTSSGQIWQITPSTDGTSGTATRLFGTLTVSTCDNFITVPNSPSLYGPLAGKILIVNENGPAETVDSAGNVAYPAGLNNISSVAVIPAASALIGTRESIPIGNYGILIAPGSQFAPILGQLLISHELGGQNGNMEHVWYDGTQLQHQVLMGTTGILWEQFGFIPAPVEPGLPNWTIYLDLNNNGVLDTGEPFTKTDANGNYSFTSLSPGTYYVREVPQTGWQQTAPAPVPPGKYTVTVAYGQVVTGLDFGNQPVAPPPTRLRRSPARPSRTPRWASCTSTMPQRRMAMATP
jgi:hypothetical protein